jgi:hypothetical protein
VNIIIEIINHKDQPLGQPGDWFFVGEGHPSDSSAIVDYYQPGDLIVRVSDLGDWRYNFLLARHEMDEAILCKANGITTKQVIERDASPEAEKDDPDSFSGYPGAPYQAQHNDALASEWQMARLLGVDWDEYGKAFSKFWDIKPEDPSPRVPRTA